MASTKIRRLLPLVAALLLAAACDASPPSPPPVTSAVPAASSSTAACVVDDRWLVGNYDHAVDYANPEVETDFFLLVYSHSPSFCRRMESRGRLGDFAFQCQSPNAFGWVVHGLWGESRIAYVQGQENRHPRFCKGDLPPLARSTLKPHLCMSPGTRLLQGQWEKHGACDFDSAEAYFARTRELYQRFPLPPKELKAKAAIRWLKDKHPELADKWLHLSGEEFGICFSTAFEVISCPQRQG